MYACVLKWHNSQGDTRPRPQMHKDTYIYVDAKVSEYAVLYVSEQCIWECKEERNCVLNAKTTLGISLRRLGSPRVII